MARKLQTILGLSLLLIAATIVVPAGSNFSMFHLEQAFATVDSVSPLSGPLKTGVAIITHQQFSDCFGTPTAHFHFAKFNGVVVTGNLCPGGGFFVPLNGLIGMNTIRVEMGPAFEVTSFVDFPFTIPHPTLNSVVPSSGQPGQNISISGSNFPLNHNIKIFVDGTQVNTLVSNSAGSISGFFSVPNLAPGGYIVEATWDGGMPSNLQSAPLQKSFTILPLPDTDGDGTPDAQDPAPNDPCIPNVTNSACDADMDGVPGDQDPDNNDPCNPDPSSTACADHYFGYFVADRTDPKFSGFPIVLSDQFGIGIYDVVKPIKMYNPAKKNAEPVHDKETHLKAYKISGPHIPVTDILLTNQFEQLVVNIKRVDSLLVPTAKSHDGPTDPLIDEPVDNFKCYKITVVSKIPSDVKKRIRVFDTNFDEVRKVKVIGKPLLCNPVEKIDLVTGQQLSEIKNPDKHLTCYKVKPRGADLGHDRIKFDTNNQFGPEILKTKNHDVLKENGKFKNRHEICVPTMKQIITNG